jgi:hypothetical protein
VRSQGTADIFSVLVTPKGSNLPGAPEPAGERPGVTGATGLAHTLPRCLLGQNRRAAIR